MSEKVFEFKRRFENKTIEEQLKTFYLILKEDFLIEEIREKDPRINIYNNRRRVKVISAMKIIPQKSVAMDNISAIIEDNHHISQYGLPTIIIQKK